MKPINAGNYSIYFNEEGYDSLNQFIKDFGPSKIAVITDTNTSKYCKPLLFSRLVCDTEIIELCISPGEENKNIETCLKVWNELSKNHFDKKSLIINLGGGVVTDLGGFVASTFLRGISFINIPTSLLAMVDASVGGKTGVDLGVLKNQIGLMANPKTVINDESYLKTLSLNHFNSGISEALKHGLIHSENHWNKLTKAKITLETPGLSEIICESVKIKNNIVAQDYFETGLRKSLNFGHTLGHAIESYSLSSRKIKPLLHGEAIAIGMVLEAFLSHIHFDLPKQTVDEIKLILKKYFPTVSFDKESIGNIISYLIFDKKNNNLQVNFVLLKKIGSPVFDIQVSNNDILNAFEYYLE
jgi:3-dehydroquinate synthase